MSFLSKLLTGDKAKAPATTASPQRRQPARPASAGNRPPNQPPARPMATVTPLRPVAAAATQVAAAAPAPALNNGGIKHHVIRSTQDLPAYKSCASNEKGRFALPNAALREHMAVLELAELRSGVAAFALIATKDFFGSAAYKAMLVRIEAEGGRVTLEAIADGAIIAKLKGGDDLETSANEEHKPVLREVLQMVQQAVEMNASDIHIEARETSVSVRMRVHGRLIVFRDSWDRAYVDKMGRALHTYADDDSKPTTFSNNCQMSVTAILPDGVKVKLRIQVVPAYPDGGMDIVIRVLRVAAEAKIIPLPDLGYAPEHVEMLDYMLSSPHGVIMLSGTTGSGKSTTLQSAMASIRDRDPFKKLISIEDPPEYVIPGCTQIPVVRRKDSAATGVNPFAQSMRDTLRMDPDVLMIGEIRDAETAELMVGMATSGHKVLTTIHTDSALSIVDRLASMGISKPVLAARGLLCGLIFQTLVQTLCKKCKVEYTLDLPLPTALHDRIRKVTKEGDTLFVQSAHGCEACNKTGISGRTVCAEMVIPDGTMRDHIMADDMKGAFEYWRSARDKRGGESMKGASALDHAILKMRRGEVSPEAVEASLGLLYDYNLEPDLDELNLSSELNPKT